MKIESVEFTAADYDEVVAGYLERERRELVTRLRRVVEETDAAFFEPLASDSKRLVATFQALVQGNEPTESGEK